VSRAALLAAVLAFPAAAGAHAKGFHKHDLVTVTARAVEVLVTLDIDSGKRCELLRAVGDTDADGQLSQGELAALKTRLVALAVRPLELEVSGYRLTWAEDSSKLDVRGDFRASDGGLSVAVLLRAAAPRDFTEGMTLSLADASPDQSHVAVEVYQSVVEGEAAELPVRQELLPGDQVKVRLGRLSNAVRK
jgi:hypothetical protein